LKIPEKPPKFDSNFISKLSPEKLRLMFAPHPEIKKLIQKANCEYLYWDRFKQQSMPESLKPEEGWIALKASRMANMRDVELKSEKSKNFTFFVTPTMQSLLSKIDQYAAGHIALTDEHSIKDFNQERYVINSLMEEAIASSQIEGAATTRKKAKEMLRTGRKPENKDQRMILNNYLTIMEIRKNWKHQPLSKELINKIHVSMAHETMDDPKEEGAYRTAEDDVHIIDDEQNILFTPPPAEKIDQMIERLCAFANQSHEDEEFIHPVIKAIIIHFWLAYIHPYVDGNGRTSRALFYWYMLSKKYWLFEYVSISRIILNARRQYERAYLYTEFDDNDLNYFVAHQLSAINKALEDLKTYLENKIKEISLSKSFLKKNRIINQRQRELLMHAIQHPDHVYTAKSFQSMFSTSYETARRDLSELKRIGYFNVHKKRKELYFVAIDGLEERLYKK